MSAELGAAEQQLREIILERHRSVRAFCGVCGLPYSTVDNVLRRGVATVTATTAAVLCDALGLDSARFIRGEIAPAGRAIAVRAPKAATWEQALVQRCQGLDDHGREMVELVAAKELERCTLAGDAVPFPTPKQPDSWRQYVGAPIACRGGGVTVATEQDARQMEQIYKKLLRTRKNGKD